MARFVFGPELGDVVITDAATGGTGGGGTGPANPDPKVTFVGMEQVQQKDAAGNPVVDAAGKPVMTMTGGVTLQIEAYDPAKVNPPVALHVVLVPNGAGMPATADLAVISPYPRSRLDVTGHTDGTPVVVPKPDTAVKGQPYVGKTVLEFAS